MTSSFSPRRPVSAEVIAWAPEELPCGDVPLGAPASSNEAPAEALVPARLLDEVRQAAFEEGFRAGEDAERTRMFHVTHALRDGLASVHEGVDRWVANAEENVAALSVAIARHILSREVAMDRDAVFAVVRLAIADFPLDHPVTVRLNPTDHAVIVGLLSTMEGEVRKDTEWVADSRIAPGGCVVEGRERIVDGRVDAALERIYRRLTYTGA
ncbi:MAG: FliH/SctL family protein [Gemmatimonadaceae bacterium]